MLAKILARVAAQPGVQAKAQDTARIVTRSIGGGAAALALALALAAISPSPVLAQQPPSTSTSSTAFDNWVFGCSTRTTPENKTVKGCEVRTTVLARNEQTKQQGPIAVIAIGRAEATAPLTAVVEVPISAALNVPLKITGADAAKPIVELPYIACQQQGCRASATITTNLLAALRGITDKLQVVFTLQNGQALNIEVAPKGLSAAIDALVKEKMAAAAEPATTASAANASAAMPAVPRNAGAPAPARAAAPAAARPAAAQPPVAGQLRPAARQ
jgi:invasion protein IalB